MIVACICCCMTWCCWIECFFLSDGMWTRREHELEIGESVQIKASPIKTCLIEGSLQLVESLFCFHQNLGWFWTWVSSTEWRRGCHSAAIASPQFVKVGRYCQSEIDNNNRLYYIWDIIICLVVQGRSFCTRISAWLVSIGSTTNQTLATRTRIHSSMYWILRQTNSEFNRVVTCSCNNHINFTESVLHNNRWRKQGGYCTKSEGYLWFGRFVMLSVCVCLCLATYTSLYA